MKKIGFGLMRLPVIDGDYTKVDAEKFREMADTILKSVLEKMCSSGNKIENYT